jgi:hypothetical protein
VRDELEDHGAVHDRANEEECQLASAIR